MKSISKVIQFVGPEERLHDELMTARALLRPLIDEDEVTEDVLEAVEDLAEDLKKAVRNYRSSGRTE